MSRRCSNCGHESEQIYRCEECQTDLVGEGSAPGRGQGGKA